MTIQVKKELVKKAHALYMRLETLEHQYEKVGKESNNDLLITVHLSAQLHIEHLPKTIILDILKIDIDKVKAQLVSLNCQV